MRFSIVTLMPELFEPFFRTSMVGRAVKSGAIDARIVSLREWGLGRHKSVDDTPYGGGSGMVLRVEPIAGALDHVDAAPELPAHRILLTPQGRPFRQPDARALSALPHVALVCGRYEGFDERVRALVNDELSLGDFVMTGGEIAAMAIVEAVARLLPGVLGNDASAASESFSEALDGALEYPQYTRPVSFRGQSVPEVLMSGHHGEIDKWRREQVLVRTQARRPELLTRTGPTDHGVPRGRGE